MEIYTLPIDDLKADLAAVGGKGASLAKLVRAGLPVPEGFHLTTAAYREFVSHQGFQADILALLKLVDPTQPSSLENAALGIEQLFLQAEIPAHLAEPIQRAYAGLPGTNPAVAVRSSATAEDLPEASFAGQQETYLNIQGVEAVLAAVRKCWASLWTARAIAYRMRQGIAPESVALAVVVQLLFPAEAAGILFTANPISGKRSEILINAAWGLGEAVVAGAVSPDTITIDKATGRILARQTAEKLVMTVRTETGTEEQPVPDARKNEPVLDDVQAAELARYGEQIEALYGTPMDIEWALAGGKFTILQARPVTALPEPPLEWVLPNPKGIYMRTSVVDLMPDPISPLFATLGISTMVAQMEPMGKYLTRMKPNLQPDYFTTINNYAYMNAAFNGRAWIWILFGLLPSYPRLLRMLVPFWREVAHPGYQKEVAVWKDEDFSGMSSSELWRAVLEVVDAAAYYINSLMFATMGASAGSEGLLTKIYEKTVRREGDPPANALLMGWNSLPIQAEKSLYDLAGFCRENQALNARVLNSPSSVLVEKLAHAANPGEVEPETWLEFRQRFNQHLDRYGHMVFQLDFAQPLPRDHPEPMVEVIKMYLRGEGSNPYERQKASEERRIRTAQESLKRLKGLKRWAFSKSLNWAQSLSEVREDALADIGLGYPLLRQMLLALGAKLVAAGALEQPEDIYWMEKDEIAQAVKALESGGFLANMQARVTQRRTFWQKAKSTTPPPMLPPRKKYMGINTTVWLAESEESQGTGTLKGVPASPGRATAPARVLHGIEDFDQMRPGEVLVAGTTTPAWTPLFAMASAVVTDIGGPLSHGSIVAREYGIPAVMGTGVATRRIRSGQVVTVDGEAGIVILS